MKIMWWPISVRFMNRRASHRLWLAFHSQRIDRGVSKRGVRLFAQLIRLGPLIIILGR